MSQPMTHRERVLAALSHQQPDRVPMDLGATRNSSIVVDLYEKLKARFGIVEPNRISNRMMQVVDVDERILTELDVDVRGVGSPAPDKGQDAELGPNRYRDEWGVVRVKPPGSHYYDQVSYPLSGEITVQDIARYPWPDPCDPGRIRGLRERVRELRRGSDCAIVLGLPSGFVHLTQYLRGFEDWYIDLAANPQRAEALFDAVLEVNVAIMERMLEEVGQEVDVMQTGDDVAVQTGAMFSPEIYRRLIKPRHARFIRRAHELSPARLLFHTCGSVVSILDDLIEIGADALNPVQVSAAGMDPLTLKKRCRGRLALWGGIDTQHLLPHGSAADVKREVERTIDVLGEGGGYVLGAVHNIQPDVPLENVLAMYRAARDYRPKN